MSIPDREENMNCSKQRHDGGAYRRMCTMIAAHAKPGKDRSKARRHDHKKPEKTGRKEEERCDISRIFGA